MTGGLRLIGADELDRLAGAGDLESRPPGDLLRRLVATIYAARAETATGARHVAHDAPRWPVARDGAIPPAHRHRRLPAAAGDARPVRVAVTRVRVRRHHSGGRTARLVGAP